MPADTPPQLPTPVLVITDSHDDDPIGLLPSPVPLLHLPSPLFTASEYRTAALVILDDRSYPTFRLRHMRPRPGLILATTDPDHDASDGGEGGDVHARAAAIGAEAVVQAAGRGIAWLHLRLHDATGCAHADWDALLTGPPRPDTGSG
ncbi:hypothetical protein [Streptomyces sp. NPDC093094]|uniref:hypothetical protein n=1 Tax=Streptomyces sp. NPDC093094 TaxID=3366026 RepID=UPI00381A1300